MKATFAWNSEKDNKEFKTELPSHETGLMTLMAQIVVFAWANGIHHFDRIVVIGEESDTDASLDEASEISGA